MPRSQSPSASDDGYHPYHRPPSVERNDAPLNPVLLHPDVVSIIGNHVGCAIRSIKPETQLRFNKQPGIDLRRELALGQEARQDFNYIGWSTSANPPRSVVNIWNADGSNKRQFKVGDMVLCQPLTDQGGDVGIGEIKRFATGTLKSGKAVFDAIVQVYLHSSDTILGDCGDPNQVYRTNCQRVVDVASFRRVIKVNSGETNGLVCKYGWNYDRNAFVDLEALAEADQKQTCRVGNFVRFLNEECKTCKPLTCIGQIVGVVSPTRFQVIHLCRNDSVAWQKAHNVARARINRLHGAQKRAEASTPENLKLIVEDVFADWSTDNKAVHADGVRYTVESSCIGGFVYVLDWRAIIQASKDVDTPKCMLRMIREHPDAMYTPSESDMAKLDLQIESSPPLLYDDRSSRFLADVVDRTKAMKSKPVIVWDLCCSAGILGAGFHRTTGFNVAVACDLDAAAVTVYKQNFPTTKALVCTISDLLQKHPAYPPTDTPWLLCAGIPCQGFSRRNMFPKYSDRRNLVIFELLSLVRKAQEKRSPDFVLIECVSGMLSHRNAPEDAPSRVERSGEVLRLAIRLFLDFGYQVSVNVLDSKSDGLVQKRRRLFIWATLKGKSLPTHESASHRADSGTHNIGQYQLRPRLGGWALARLTTNDDAFSDLPLIDPDDVKPVNGQRRRYFGHLEPTEYRYRPRNNFQRLVRGEATQVVDHFGSTVPTETHAQLLAQSQAIERRYDTVLTANVQINHRHDRPLSILEWRRIQGIPDDHWLGGEPGGARYMAYVGNAVPFPMAKARARELIEACWKDRKKDEKENDDKKGKPGISLAREIIDLTDE